MGSKQHRKSHIKPKWTSIYNPNSFTNHRLRNGRYNIGLHFMKFKWRILIVERPWKTFIRHLYPGVGHKLIERSELKRASSPKAHLRLISNPILPIAALEKGKNV